MQSIKIKTENTELDAALYLPTVPKDKNPALLFIHGWESRKERGADVAAVLAEKGFISLIFDLRGHGQTLGDLSQLSLKDFVDDCIAAYDYLVQVPGVDLKNITLSGSSLGSYLAAVLSSLRPASKLALRVPADFPDENFNTPRLKVHGNPGVTEWRMEPHDFNATKALRVVHDFKGKIFIAESGKDDIVHHQVIENYVNAVADKNQLTFFLMPDAPHSLKDFPEQAKLFEDKMVGWLLN